MNKHTIQHSILSAQYADVVQTTDETTEYEKRLRELENQTTVTELDTVKLWAALRTKSFSNEVVLQQCKRRARVIEPIVRRMHDEMVARIDVDPRFAKKVTIDNTVEQDPDFKFLIDALGRRKTTLESPFTVEVAHVPLEVCMHCGYTMENTLAVRSVYYAHLICAYLKRL